MRTKPSQSEQNSKALEGLRESLRSRALIHDENVQKLLETAYNCYGTGVFNSVAKRLELILEAYNKNASRKPDSFRPYAPSTLLSQGQLHIADQMDGIPFLIDPNKLVTGLIVFGPQGSGKSRLISNLCTQIQNLSPSVTITIIDPKFGFRGIPNFKHINLAKASFDLTPPANIDQSNFIYEFIPILANSCGLIFGLDFLNQAIDITLSKLYQTSERAICLEDILESLKKIKTNNFRLVGYLDAAKTALSLILGKQNLFSCRKGLSLEWLFSRNTILNARSLTHEMQCKVFVLFLLFYLYQSCKNQPEIKELRHILIIDDSTRFIGGNNSYQSQRTSQLGHILAVLRASGIACIFATQLPAQVDKSVLSLSRNMVVVGNVNGEENLKVIQNFMSLTINQKNDILRFKTRESAIFISGSAWSYPVHGWIPLVEDYQGDVSSEVKLEIVRWRSLDELRQEVARKVEPKIDPPKAKMPNNKLVWNCINHPFDKVRARVDRLEISMREYEAEKNANVQDGYLIYSTSGKTVYLIPTKKAFDLFEQPCPYQRSTSIEHSFYVSLAVHILKRDSSLRVEAETPVGKKGSTIDITAISKSGEMTAFEVTISTSNLLSNATKLQDLAYQKIVWLTKDSATAKAVKSYFNKSRTLPDELINRFEYIHFSKFEKRS